MRLKRGFFLVAQAVAPLSDTVAIVVNLRMARVLVSGMSGPIGGALLPTLKASGAQITRLVRRGSSHLSSDEQQIPWDPAQPLAPESVSGFDAVIHLAGEGIATRWTAAKKSSIRYCRVNGTRNLATACA